MLALLHNFSSKHYPPNFIDDAFNIRQLFLKAQDPNVEKNPNVPLAKPDGFIEKAKARLYKKSVVSWQLKIIHIKTLKFVVCTMLTCTF